MKLTKAQKKRIITSLQDNAVLVMLQDTFGLNQPQINQITAYLCGEEHEVGDLLFDMVVSSLEDRMEYLSLLNIARRWGIPIKHGNLSYYDERPDMQGGKRVYRNVPRRC